MTRGLVFRRLGVFLASWLGAGVFAAAALATPGAIVTVAGDGTPGFAGDHHAATSAEISASDGVTPLPGGGFLIADTANNRIREVSPSGVITTVAGTGVPGYNGDGIKATKAKLDGPRGVVALPGGGFLIADFDNNRVRKVSPSGIITTVAGTGTSGYSGDGGPADLAQLSVPRSLSLLPGGGYLIADHGNCAVRKVSASGIITTVAGEGPSKCGFSGDGGQATAAKLAEVTDVAALPHGGFLFSDGPDDRVREVSPAGVIRTVAGTGTTGFSGDGGPATAAELGGARGVAPLVNGGFLVADEGNNRIRRVSASGVITTVAGNGMSGFAGDHGPATKAGLQTPEDVALNSTGGFLIADAGNARIRLVHGGPPTATIISPRGGRTYTRGARITTRFSCQENLYGTGLSSCDDSNGKSTVNGGRGRLNTAKTGVHTYRVTATSADGQSRTTHITYTVVAGAKITQAQILSKRHSAIFSFKARGAKARLQCALAHVRHHEHPKLSFVACHSPKTYEHLRSGKYLFEVRTVTGAAHGPPARKSFEIS